MLTANLSIQDESSICSLTGEVDGFTAPQLHSLLVRAPRTPEVVVDFAGVPFVDSSGVHAIAAVIRNLRAAGVRVVLSVPAAHMRRLFRAIGLDRLAPVCDGVLIPSAEAAP